MLVVYRGKVVDRISVRGPNGSFGNQTGRTINSSKPLKIRDAVVKPLMSRVG